MKLLNAKYLILSVLLMTMMSESEVIFAQAKKPKTQKPKGEESFWKRTYWGGNLGLQFGTYTYIEVAPVGAYKITEKLHAGLGITYSYLQDKSVTPAYSSNMYGASVFSRYFIWRDLCAHAEYEYLNREVYDYMLNEEVRVNLNNVLLGGGYRQWLGDRAFATILVLFNLNESYYSPYSNPIIEIGFGVGL